MNIIETELVFGPMKKRSITNAIVLHHSANRTWNVYDIHRYHKNERKWSGIGYHFFIEKDGEIYRGRPEEFVGAHCFNNNNYTIGICVQGDYMTEVMPEKQRESVCELCKYLCNKYKIEKIRGHRDLNPTKCPGVNFPLADFRKLLAGYINIDSKKVYIVKKNDTLWKIAWDNNISLKKLKDNNNLTSDIIHPGQSLFI